MYLKNQIFTHCWCNQFESLLESFEEEIKILKIEKERRGQVENLITDCKVKVAPENEKIVFESILESSEEELKILEIEKNPYYQLHEQVQKPIKDFKVEVVTTTEQNVEDDFSYKDKLEEMNILNWRLGLYFQELFKIENGLNTFEDDSTYNGMKNIVPEEQNVLAILVKAGLHFEYIQIKINKTKGTLVHKRG